MIMRLSFKIRNLTENKLQPSNEFLRERQPKKNKRSRLCMTKTCISTGNALEYKQNKVKLVTENRCAC